jgi:hypothetical protein
MHLEFDTDDHGDVVAPHTPTVVPVTIEHTIPVQPVPTRTWTTGQITMNSTDQPRLVVGRNPARVRITFRTSTSTGACWIGSTPQQATPTSGFPIPNFAGESVTLTSCHEVYATTQVDGATLSWLAEHVDG